MTMATKKMRNDDAALAKWAEDPTTWNTPEGVLRGDAAAAYGRSVLEAAGVDVVSVERAAGRPRVGRRDSAPKGIRSPRVNVSISQTQDQLLDQLVRDRGRSRSELVREALDTYLSHPV
jgi:Ribbon-helix-helix protein, copG family